MAEVSVLGEKLVRLLKASKWDVESDRFTITATEHAFEAITRTWMAGSHRALSEAEITVANPSRIVVDDSTPSSELVRLSKVLDALGSGGSVSTYSRFVDEFWGAADAVKSAMMDADVSEADQLFEFGSKGTNDRHVVAQLSMGQSSVPDHRALESGLPGGGACLVILADAGLGKSEMLRWHEWRNAVTYQSALESNGPFELPSVSLRVPLRDFKSLSLDYVAHQISHPTQSGRPHLSRITSGAVLRELLIQRRLVLFLDGLDEVSADSATIDEGIAEWRKVVRDGGQFVLTSRSGHDISLGMIGRRFDSKEIAYLRPLERPGAQALLHKRGIDEAAADRVIAALSGPSAGIPLFLLLANHVGLDTKLSQEVAESRTLVLLNLLQLFCKRDEARMGVSADEQIDVLTQIAEWNLETGPLDQDELLRNLGLDEDDPLAAIVRNPHALLLNDDGKIAFKFAEFGSLFTARAVAESWSNFGYGSVRGILSSQNLGDLVVEYLARLLPAAMVSGTWVGSEFEFDGALILRRNLLAIALAKVADEVDDSNSNSNTRAVELAKVLGNRAIVNVSLSGLFIHRFDFAGWQIKKVHGHGGTFSYCENLWRSDHDDSVDSAVTDECGFDPPSTVEIDVATGVTRLRQLTRQIRRKHGRGVVAMMQRDDRAKDPAGWELLVHLQLAELTGKAQVAKWYLNVEGMRILTAFNMADTAGEEALNELIAKDSDVRSLVEQFAKS
jgi:hypothetical protein